MQLTVVAPHDFQDAQGLSAADQDIESLYAQFVQGAADQALGAPAVSQQPRTLKVTTSAWGDSIELDVVPEAIPDLMLFAYASGGRKAFNALGLSIINAAAGLRKVAHYDFKGLSIIDAVPGVWATNPAPTGAIKFVVETYEAHTDEVVATLASIAADAYALAATRIATAHRRLAEQKTRYQLRPENSGPTENSGAEGGPGSSYYSNFTVMSAGNPAAARELVEIVQNLIALRNQADRIRQKELSSAMMTGLSGAGGAPGSDNATKEEKLSSEGEQRIRDAEAAFQKALGLAIEGERGHPIAPAVFALIMQDQPFGNAKAREEEILAAADKYMEEGMARLATALPAEFSPTGVAAIARVSAYRRLANIGRGEEDTPETRVALWARRPNRGYAYEPLDDEYVLMALLKRQADALAAAPDELTEFRLLYRYQVIVALITARDTVDAVAAAEADADAKRAFYDTAGAVADVLDLVGLFLWPLEAIGLAISSYVLVGSALIAIGEIDAANAAIDAKVVSALMQEEGAQVAMLLASRPTMFDLALLLGRDIAAFMAIGKVSRTVALAVHVLLALDAIAAGVGGWLLPEEAASP